MATISVVIPTFNRKELLRRALQSVYSQTHQPDHVIVVDDGSTDHSDAMVASEFPDTQFIIQTHGGVSKARNCGVEASKTDWIAFLDSDDEWLVHKLERQYEYICTKSEASICHCDEIWIRSGVRVNPKKKHRKSGGRIYTKCLPLCAISPSAVVIHRNVLAEVGGFDESLPVCEDYDLWLRITSRFSVGYIDEPLVIKHGGHPDQLSRAFPAMDFYRITALRKVLQEDYLTLQERCLTLETMLNKLSIYCDGAEKRGRYEEVRELKELSLHYTNELEALELNV